MENFEVFEDVAGEWRWRVKGNNGKIVTSSEGYVSESNAWRGVRDLKEIVEFAVVPIDEIEGQTREGRRSSDGGLQRTPSTKVEEYIAAAHCYLSAAHKGNGYDLRQIPMDWPWRREDWKPGTKLENMEKAEAILRETIALYRGEDD